MRESDETRISDSPEKMSAPPKPIQVLNGETQRFNPHDMQIVPVVRSIPEFELPEDWVVEVRPRGPNSSLKISDKYYYEPGSGRQFRSLISVKRYLSGEEHIEIPRKKPSNSLVILRPDELEEARQGDLDDIYPETIQPKSASILPDGWIVEEIPRRCGFRSDRYYIEPGTGQRFRSVPEVQRYLASPKYSSKGRALTLKNHSTAPRSPAPRKKNTSLKMFKTSIIDLTNPPEKINWVFSGDEREDWSPLVEECMLPDYVKEQWAETFLLGMNGWKHKVPQLTMGEINRTTNA
ncbi:methyl-CpG-binding domain-containing protein 7 isoform X2 [Beta vulgaris subsp. vulgaris]|uniref:methyl-CpG-binding domain-containing protein 7 isoform X2 n=1 Tax=Beta vulgaris subsp. vulgaris TaxID=3555 RepID=UPI0020371D99|nr:methyl-CpG-binding domain-containing protein 7 isoform X2 [Beta vulgaris subsp. vulgaris]